MCTIILQNNSHYRDYVYEISTLYLVSRAIHLAVSERISEKISAQGMSIDRVVEVFPEYSFSALKDWFELLACYGIFLIKDAVIYQNALSEELKNLPLVEKEEWLQSYDIENTLSDKNYHINSFPENVFLEINQACLTIKSDIAKSVITELSLGYIVSRTLRQSTILNIFELIHATKSNAISFFNLTQRMSISKDSLLSMLKILERYFFVKYDPTSGIVFGTVFSPYLTSSHPESYRRTMFMIDEKWWHATAYLKRSLIAKGVSGFEYANKETFYQAYLGHSSDSYFNPGMAEISLLEDKIVAEAIKNKLEHYDVFIDIAGGDGGLLKSLFSIFGPAKKYVLFEKAPLDVNLYENEKKILSEIIHQKIDPQQKIEIVLGDYYEEKTRIPKYENAAYLMKCTLHNIPEYSLVVKILKNIKLAMGNNSMLMMAERILPDNTLKPHFNRTSNFLMRLLFKAESYDISFYQKCIDEAGFLFQQYYDAKNYIAMEVYPKVGG